MALRQDSPVGQLASYVEGLETVTAQQAVEIAKLKEELAKPAAPSGPEGWEIKADIVIAIAKAFDALRIPYVFGGESIKGMDCSAFVQAIYRQIGYNMPRVSRDQAKIGIQIDKTNDKLWRKGDLVAFDYNDEGTVDHIGIYLGNGTMIHTNTPSTGINIKAVNDKTNDLYSVNRVIR